MQRMKPDLKSIFTFHLSHAYKITYIFFRLRRLSKIMLEMNDRDMREENNFHCNGLYFNNLSIYKHPKKLFSFASKIRTY